MKESDATNRSSMKEIVASRSGEKRASTSGEGLDRSFNDEQRKRVENFLSERNLFLSERRNGLML